MNYEKLADLLFPDVTKTVEDLEKEFPKRELEKGAVVTRFAPSPTGYLHTGSLYACLVASRMAKSTGGLFILRVEDTDQTREINGAVKIICEDLKKFNISFDEGRDEFGKDFGEYGPYRQSERKEIYRIMAKQLVKEGKAFPCFCNKERTDRDRETQERNKELIGYYASYAHCRNLTLEEIEENLKNNMPFAIRLKVDSSPNTKIIVEDAIRGTLKLSDNYNNVVVLKSDQLPPYNFAHACDDHFMRVNLVMRGDEYIASIAEHLQIFNALNFEKPKYAHLAPIEKMENSSRRKISKRKDPEAKVSYYFENGYPVETVDEYLMTIANSNFEDWRTQNPTASVEDFKISLAKMSKSGALLDFLKLNDVSKNVISKFTAQKVYDYALSYAMEYNKPFAKILEENKDFAIAMFSIERGTKKPRKDLSMFSQVESEFAYMFEQLFNPTYAFDERFNKEQIISLVEKYVETYNESDEKQQWFDKVKFLGESINVATDMKEYKQNPENFLAHYGDVATLLRMAITGRTQSPDLYEICKILTKKQLEKRLEILKNTL